MRERKEVSRLEQRALELERRLYDVRSRYLVLFITFTYKSDCRDAMRFDDIQRHRNRLLNNKRNNALVKGIKGYVWKIEKGTVSGLHVR